MIRYSLIKNSSVKFVGHGIMGFKEAIKHSLMLLKDSLLNSLIYFTYYNMKIDEHAIYVESRDGNDFTGNILRIVEEISSGEYGDYKIYVFAKKGVHEKIKRLSKSYNLKIHRITSREAVATMFLERAKYCFTDSGIRPKYVKREGQIFIDTWHGTPLKVMGRYNRPEEHRTANIQHPFICADYLLYPNDFMKEKMLNGYMIENLYMGTILNEGYPRNSVFFNDERREEMKSLLNLQDKDIFVYMPTYRGTLLNRKDKAQTEIIKEYLREIDARLGDDQVFIVKLHVFNRSNIDFSEFKHIIDFPSDYETYDILNMADCLITDYSSVFFDFANTKRKIIIFNYDEEEYMADRETYFPLSHLPFPKVQNVDDLIDELNSPKEYDDSEFLRKFCTYDNPNAVKNICKRIFNGEKISKEERIEKDGKNVLIFGGGLYNNGITSSLLNLLYGIDKDKCNIFISYRLYDEYINENHYHVFDIFPDYVEFFGLRSFINPTFLEKFAYHRFLRAKNPSKYVKYVKRIFEREMQRYYPNLNFDAVINFDGYGSDQTLMFAYANANNSIWVHNDMVQEIKTRSNQNFNSLKEAYNNYDNVIVVSEDLIGPTSEISGKEENIKVIHNINYFNGIIDKSNKELKLDDTTEIVTSNPNGIEGVLESKGKKFITIGRFSPEKGHMRLMNSFDKFCNDYPDSQLIIIGGHGVLYEKTVELRENLKYGDNITLIKWISNPMPILGKCDLFILPSFYEGWGMVIMEADTLSVPVIATDVVGVQWMRDYNGYLVENSDEGILQGMYDFMNGKVSTLDIDYEKYNQEAIEDFYSILN